MDNINFKGIGEDKIMIFARTYFPKYIGTNPCEFHRELCRLLEQMSKERGKKLAVAAPRGHAKSTLVSLVYVLWCVCYEREKYILILSDTNDQAEGLLKHVKDELEDNERLRRDFPNVCVTDDDGKLPLWTRDEIVTKNGIKITALGAGQKIRGRRNQEHRPSLIILDDIENDQNTQSKESMDKLNEWFERAVLKSGAKGTNVVFVGTIQSYGCLLSRYTKENRPGWESRTYKAVLSFAKREDLWGKWKVYYNGDEQYGDKTGALAALEFYRDNEKDLLEGTSVLWPEKEDYYTLMVMLQDDGESSFSSEKQNEPIDPKSAVFKWDSFQYWDDVYKTEEELRQKFGDQLVFYAACDPSLGKPGKRGDYSAIIVIAKHEDTGKAYVLDADIAKRSPEELVEAVVTKGRFYAFRRVFIEANQFQELLVRDIENKAYSEGVTLNIEKKINTSDKIARIQSLATWVNDGRIMFARNQRLLIDQLKHFPKAAHDDGPDALAMVIHSAATENRIGFLDLNAPLTAEERRRDDEHVSSRGETIYTRDYGPGYRLVDPYDDD